ncbi:hypothetical protein [Streptomyces spinosisporus]|uniref:Uncharacterized protein n=1 Tax=Streptomyces spinosisporus TaxID=2927582 RepID=A0ABS9XBG2_9ACTN|nr:hypothetical protein [Streptomyces spinosisporus]MCI3238212.1 hypothetical protein [Streptomyces spinosisporus]
MLSANAEKGQKAANSVDSYVRRLERHADELTPEHIARLAGLVLRDQPNRKAELPAEKAAELRRLIGGGSQ